MSKAEVEKARYPDEARQRAARWNINERVSPETRAAACAQVRRAHHAGLLSAAQHDDLLGAVTGTTSVGRLNALLTRVPDAPLPPKHTKPAPGRRRRAFAPLCRWNLRRAQAAATQLLDKARRDDMISASESADLKVELTQMGSATGVSDLMGSFGFVVDPPVTRMVRYLRWASFLALAAGIGLVLGAVLTHRLFATHVTGVFELTAGLVAGALVGVGAMVRAGAMWSNATARRESGSMLMGGALILGALGMGLFGSQGPTPARQITSHQARQLVAHHKVATIYTTAVYAAAQPKSGSSSGTVVEVTTAAPTTYFHLTDGKWAYTPTTLAGALSRTLARTRQLVPPGVATRPAAQLPVALSTEWNRLGGWLLVVIGGLGLVALSIVWCAVPREEPARNRYRRPVPASAK